MSGFPTRGATNDTNPVMLGQSVALIGQPISGNYLPVGSTINRSEYLALSECYPNLFAMQKVTFGVPGGLAWSGVAYGNGIYVAVAGGSGIGSGTTLYGNCQSVATSTDGINWIIQDGVLPASHYWSGIAFGNGVFVAVSATVTGNTIAYSTDGLSWTGVASTITYYGVSFGNGIFVLYGGSSSYAVSTDGRNFTVRAWANVGSTWGCRFTNGKFWRVTSSTALYYSTDGLNWAASTLPTSTYWGSIAWNGSLYILGSTNGTAFCTSPDGVTWTSRTQPEAKAGCACAIGKMFILFSGSTSSTAYFSTNGINWTSFSAWPKVFCLFEEASRVLAIPQAYSTGYDCSYGQSTTITLTGTAGQYVRVR